MNCRQKDFGIQNGHFPSLWRVCLQESLRVLIFTMCIMSVLLTILPSLRCWRLGSKGGGYGAAAAFGASFLFARILEGPLVGILDIGGSLQTGIGIGVPALMLGAGFTAPLTSFPLALATGALLGLIIGTVIIMIRKYTINASNSTFGADVMMGAGNAAGRYLGPLIVISAIMASIPVGLGATAGAAIFYYYNKPIAGGAIIGAMILGAIFPIPTQ